MRTYTIGLNSQILRLSDSLTIRFFQIHGLSQNLPESPRLSISQVACFSKPLSTRLSNSQIHRLVNSRNPRSCKHAYVHNRTGHSDSQALRFSDSQTLRLPDPVQVLRLSNPQTLRHSDSLFLRLSDYQTLRLSDSQILRLYKHAYAHNRIGFSDSQALRLSDSQNLRLSDRFQTLRLLNLSQALTLSHLQILRHSDYGSQTL